MIPRLLRLAPLARARFLSSATPLRPRLSVNRAIVASSATLTASLLLWHDHAAIHADAPSDNASPTERQSPKLSTLVRSYLVYTMCSFPTLVDWSPTLLDFLTSIPGLKQVTEAFVGQTFFAHFVGGPTAEACLPLLARLRDENKGILFAYSVEVDDHEAAGKGTTKSHVPVHKRIVQEMLHSINVAANFEDAGVSANVPPNCRRTWVAIKLTALLPDHQALINFSAHLTNAAAMRPHSPPVAFPGCPRADDLDILNGLPPPNSGLSPDNIRDIADLYADLRTICAHAQKRRVRLILDAEYSWYQPAIDSISLALMREFNQLPSAAAKSPSSAVHPLVYITCQAYLRRTPEFLAQSLRDAKDGSYALGVKLVRGAYHEQEALAHPHEPSRIASGSPSRSLSISPDLAPPVWISKADTDRHFDAAASLLLSTVAASLAPTRFWLPFRSSPPATPTIGVLFGSHNWTSMRRILDELVAHGLATHEGVLPVHMQVEGHAVPGERVVRVPDAVSERVTLAQLYGMSDALTNYLVARTRSSTPFVIKYLPYGALTEVMPYLARRAIENKSVLGGGQAAMERQQAWKEIRKALAIWR